MTSCSQSSVTTTMECRSASYRSWREWIWTLARSCHPGRIAGGIGGSEAGPAPGHTAGADFAADERRDDGCSSDCAVAAPNESRYPSSRTAIGRRSGSPSQGSPESHPHCNLSDCVAGYPILRRAPGSGGDEYQHYARTGYSPRPVAEATGDLQRVTSSQPNASDTVRGAPDTI